MAFCLTLCVLTRAQAAEPSAAPRFETLDVADGLTANEVNAIVQDRRGYLWVGTWGGLHRYDGASFRAFLRDPADSLSLTNSWVWKLVESQSGDLWVATDGGLSRFDPATETFTNYLHDPDDPSSLGHNEVRAVAEDARGTLWVGTRGGGLSRFDSATETFTHFRHDARDGESLRSDNVYALAPEPSGALWVGTAGGLQRLEADGKTLTYHRLPGEGAPEKPPSVFSLHRNRAGTLWIGTRSDGLYRFDPATETFAHYPARDGALGHPWVLTIAEGAGGALWVGTDGGGLHRYDPVTDTFARYVHDPGDPQSLSDDRVLSVATDRTGTLWVGTYRGLGRRYPLSQHLTYEHYRPGDRQSLNSSDISAFLEDRSGTLWVGTDGHGLNRRDARTGTFASFRHAPSDPESLGNDAVIGLVQDDAGAIWVGTYDGLYRRVPQSGRFERFDPQGDAPQITVAYSLAYSGGHLWVGTYRGLFEIETATGRATYYAPDEPSGMYEFVTAVYPEASGSVWVGTFTGGLGRLDPRTGRFERLRSDAPDPTASQWGVVLDLYRSREGTFWVGGGTGLYRLEEEQSRGEVQGHRRAEGLPHTPVDAMIEDGQGRLWISTVHGLSWLDASTRRLLHYDADDGFWGGGTLYRSPRTGRIYAGGTRGYYSFDPSDIAKETPLARPILTGLRLQNERVTIGREGSPLDRLLSATEELRLRHDDRVVTFEFAALDFRAPATHRYAVRLDGFDEVWREVGGQREATFTNLSPGRYTFRVRAAGRDGVWGDEEATLAVVVAPPLWGTWGAYLGYLALVVGGLALVYRNRQNRVALRHQAEMERLEAEQLRELDRAKSRFFANVSHEFRTPLTLTLGPLDDVLGGEHGVIPNTAREQLGLARRNAGRVLALINQILDIARLEAGRTELRAYRLDLGAFVKRVAQSFRSLAQRKALAFDVTVDTGTEIWGDPDQLEQVIANLLSNAVKFTPEGGTIRVSVESEGEMACIRVRDSGPGIPAEELPFVFDRFHRASEGAARLQPGTGIGLALAREIVDLHGGTLSVESEEGFGSTFMVGLRLGHGHLAPEQIARTPLETAQPWHPTLPTLYECSPSVEAGEASEEPSSEQSDVTTVLVVEDHAEVRAYVRRHLEPSYRVVEAATGDEGVTQARVLLPDLVLSDVMMPGLDGFELCRVLKADPETDFIPILLLTARAEQEDRIEGLGAACDGYLTKPFDVRELRVRVDNLIASRKRLRERFTGDGAPPLGGGTDMVLRPAPVEATSADAAFVEAVRTAIESRLGDEAFSVAGLAEAVGVSRGHLHRQLKALVGQTPSEAIRTMRLERAAQLLEARAGTVSEVAYAVGFRSVSHFSNAFDRHFGCRPSVFPRAEG